MLLYHLILSRKDAVIMSQSIVKSPFEEPPYIIQKMMKVYIAKINEALDGHVRPVKYEDCLDPRSGMVEGMKAVLRVIKEK